MFKIKVFDEKVYEIETAVNTWLAEIVPEGALNTVKLEAQTVTIEDGMYRRLQMTFSYLSND